MGLRKGNVQVDTAAATAETPPFTPEAAPAPAPAPAAAPAPAPQPAPAITPATTNAVEQHESASQAATQAAPAPAPVAVPQAPMQTPMTRSSGAADVTGANVVNQLHDDGFDGLEFGFGSFPMISLQNSGNFETSEGGNLGQEFECCILGSKPKWIYKNGQKGPAEDFFYSFDQVTTISGEPIEQILAQWEAQGWTAEIKKYLDVQAQMVTDDEDNGSLVLLSIPPTSNAKFSGYIATIRGRYGKRVSDVITKCSLGEKVTKVKHPFNPWSFSYSGDMH